MTTRYEFGYGYGEIYRRRQRGRAAMRRQRDEGRRAMPEEARARLRYESDYYGFRGAGRRSSYGEEYRVQPRAEPRSGRRPEPRRPAPERPRRRGGRRELRPRW